MKLLGLILLAVVVAFVGALVSGLFVMLFLGQTSIDSLHIGYWDAFWISLAASSAVAGSTAATSSARK